MQGGGGGGGGGGAWAAAPGLAPPWVWREAGTLSGCGRAGGPVWSSRLWTAVVEQGWGLGSPSSPDWNGLLAQQASLGSERISQMLLSKKEGRKEAAFASLVLWGTKVCQRIYVARRNGDSWGGLVPGRGAGDSGRRPQYLAIWGLVAWVGSL